MSVTKQHQNVDTPSLTVPNVLCGVPISLGDFVWGMGPLFSRATSKLWWRIDLVCSSAGVLLVVKMRPPGVQNAGKTLTISSSTTLDPFPAQLGTTTCEESPHFCATCMYYRKGRRVKGEVKQRRGIVYKLIVYKTTHPPPSSGGGN